MTVRSASPVKPAASALIVVVPELTPVASPPLSMAATAGFDEAQVAVAVTSWVVASLSVTTAWKACVPWIPMLAELGVTASDCTLAVGTVMAALARCPL